MILPTDYSRTNHRRSMQVLKDLPLPAIDHETILASYLTLLHHYTASSHLQISLQLPHPEEPLQTLTAQLTPQTTLTDLLQNIQYTAAADTHPIMFSLADNTTRTLSHHQEIELCLTIEQQADRSYLEIAYDSALFSKSTIQRMTDNLLTLLQAVMEQPDRPLLELPFLSASERQHLASFNQTAVPFPEHQTIQQAFSEQVKRTPDNIAVRSQGRSLTYQHLHERSNQMARLLSARGCGRGDLIAILIDRSPEMFISILGVLKTGAGYLPIDPDAPESRITYMLEDSQAKLVLTKTHLRSLVPLPTDVLCWEETAANLDACSSEDLELVNTADDLAYIIYTSGSTGKPKGTMLCHRGVVNMGIVQRAEMFIHEKSRLLQFASYSFDASILEIFTVFLCGATLVTAPKEVTRDPALLAELMRRERITFAVLVPAILQQLPREVGPDLETVISGGEACPAYLAEQWAERVNLINAYGPTETTVIATLWSSKVAGYVPNPLPIGKTLPNVKVYILNERLQQVPIGVPGEIYIGGPGVAMGYFNRPELTAERFLADPFAKGERMYRSGDLGRYLQDGNIEFLGRADKQVKLRGFRIELGEIEAVMAEHPSVKECVVILDESRSFKRLLGYAVPNGDLSPAELRAYIGERMPEYMVPAQILPIASIPLTINGKVDQKALPLPEEGGTDSGYAQPETESQACLAEIWQDALGIKQVGLHDNFFDLGGDSLVIFPIVMRMKDRYPGVSVQDVYKHPTVFELDRYLAESMKRELVQPDEDTSFEETAPALTEWGEAEPPQAVLLTGATGYLGAYLLRELMDKTDAFLYCLVRSRHNETAWERLKKNMQFYFGESILIEMEQRVKVITGDLGEPRLGLAETEWELLRKEIDLILHCGADVRHYGEKESIEKANVQGTEELLALARGREGVRFHFVSTVSVVIGPEENVYVKSKRASETLVRSAGKEGVRTTIFRAGNLVGHSETGLFQHNIESNAFYRMLKGTILLGVAYGEEREVDLTPVDYAARAIIEYGMRAGMEGQIFHICNPQTIRMRHVIQEMLEMGYPVRVMELNEYRNWIMELNRTGQQQDAVQLLLADLMEAEEAIESGMQSFEGRGACDLLVRAGVRCPEPDAVLIRRLVEYAVQAGYFPTAQLAHVK